MVLQQDGNPVFTKYSTFVTMERIKEFSYSSWIRRSYIVALLLLILSIWGIGYSIFGDEVAGLQSPLVQLIVLFISAKLCGYVVGLIKIPPMVGMLLMGVLLQNVHFLNLSGGYLRFASLLRTLALVNILLPAGLGLDSNVLKKQILMILNLAIVPVFVEVLGVTILAHVILDLPWIWGILLGVLLAAVSPAVIIPCLFELQDRGYGVDKGIHTLVIAASTFNDIICVALFGVFIGVIFSSGTLAMQILQGPIILASGFCFGSLWGMVCIYVPNVNEKYKVTLRTLMLGLGCTFAALSSEVVGYAGAGPLACIVAAFVASHGWKKQGWGPNNHVRANFVLLWKFFEPISFALIGLEVKFEMLSLTTVLWGILVMMIPLLLRVLTSFATTQCGNFNFKENVFIAMSWIPKATVQATLGPVALDFVRSASSHADEQLQYASDIVVIAVLSILLTSPIGAVLIMGLGPKLLHKTEPIEELSDITTPRTSPRTTSSNLRNI